MTYRERYGLWKSRRTPEERKKYSRESQKRAREKNANYYHDSNRTVKHRYGVLKNAAKHRGLDCAISFEEYARLTSSPCFYCGGVLSETGGGLDRVINAVGYVAGNVRPCCHPCNQAKSDFTESQFQEWVLRVYNTYILGSHK